MHKLSDVRKALNAGEMDESLARLTCSADPAAARRRVAALLDGFERSFGRGEDTPVTLCSAPGRTEICGNHQHGRVLAAAVNVDFLACAAPNGTDTIRFQSEGWPMVEVQLDGKGPREDEKEITPALVRGMAEQAAQRGYTVEGYDVYAVSDVLPGSGLSSSAACEVLLGVIENHLFCNDELSPVTIAQMGQKAENLYFGKPSGLMDQTASSVGGAVAIDFADPADPKVRTVSVDLNALGYALCIIDSGASHAALTSRRRWARLQRSLAGRCCARWMRRRCFSRCRSCGRSWATARCCARCTSSRTISGLSERPTHWQAATWTPSCRWCGSRAAPPGSFCRTSPQPARCASRRWRSR